MKTITFKKTLGALAITTALLGTHAFALEVGTHSLVNINGDGMVHVTNAEVTSVSGNVVNAVARFKDLVTSWTITTNASTTITDKSSNTTGMTAVQVGDRIDIKGALTSFGTALSINASKIVDRTSLSFRGAAGTVQSVNTANGTFVLKMKDSKTITVQTNANTTLTAMTTATSTPTSATLAALAANSKVHVTGTLNAEGTVLTATEVRILPVSTSTNPDKKQNNGFWHGLKNGWKEKYNRDNTGEHKGFFKTYIGVGL